MIMRRIARESQRNAARSGAFEVRWEDPMQESDLCK